MAKRDFAALPDAVFFGIDRLATIERSAGSGVGTVDSPGIAVECCHSVRAVNANAVWPKRLEPRNRSNGKFRIDRAKLVRKTIIPNDVGKRRLARGPVRQ